MSLLLFMVMMMMMMMMAMVTMVVISLAFNLALYDTHIVITSRH